MILYRGQTVYVCSHAILPREGTVEEVNRETAWVKFVSTSGEPMKAEFWLSDGSNCGNRAYWIQTEI